MLVSIIIPVYNVSDYLTYAMDSLLQQTYDNIEIILVNDGSTDESGTLCDDYAQKYEHVFAHHKKNGGLSDARNYGVQYAKGEWITFLDPDDYIEKEAIAYMMAIQKKYQADIVSTKVQSVNEYEKYSHQSLFPIDDNVKAYTKEEALKEMLLNNIATVSACGKLYKKQILLDNPFPVGKIYEDLYLVARLLKGANHIYISEKVCYYYYQREGSIVNSKFNKKQYHFFDAIDYNKEMINQYYDNKKLLLTTLTTKAVHGGFDLVNKAIKADALTDVKQLKDIFKQYKTQYLNNKEVTYKSKLKYLLFIFVPSIYVIMYRFKK